MAPEDADTTPSTSIARRGRPPGEPPKRWRDYLDVLETIRPARFPSFQALHAWLAREHPFAIQANYQAFQRVLNGVSPPRPGLGGALIAAYGLQGAGLVAEDFDLPAGEFRARLGARSASGLSDLIAGWADGTTIHLEGRGAGPRSKHFGADTLENEEVLIAKQSYALRIARPIDLPGVDGPLLLLGFGLSDRRWQFVSAVADNPLPPDRRVQWGAATGVSLTVSSAAGPATLYAIGSQRPFPTTFVDFFERHRNMSRQRGLLSPSELLRIEDLLAALSPQRPWAALLHYRVET